MQIMNKTLKERESNYYVAERRRFMKKTKILAVLGICFALGIVACNKGNSDNPGPGGDSNTSQKSDDSHKHSFGKWTQTVAPTCTTAGSEERVCECGEKETREVKALGHDFANGTVVGDTATCTVDGKQTIKCARCDATQEVDSKAHHNFGDETKVAKTGTDDVDYYTALCSVDSALKLRFPTEVGGKYEGTTRKNGTPEGYTKLTGNGSISWTINLAGTKGYLGKMYHMACMDAITSNSEKNYGYYTTSGSSTRESGNFNFYVNGALTDKSAYMNISFGDLTKDGVIDPALDAITESPGPYSPVALCPIADDVYIQPGQNVFKYERTGSYNMVMSDLVFIGVEFEHVHAAASTWSSDADNHWHACTAPGCPTGKLDSAAHTYEEVTAEGVTATCAAEGKKVEKCTICEYKKETALPKLAHTLGDAYDVVPATCEAAGSQKKKCSVCDEVVTEVLPKAPHSFGEAVANYAAGEGYIASTAHNCSICGKSALRWSALAYDATKTADRSTAGPESRDSGKAIRWSSTPNYSGGDVTVKGCHIVYNVKILEDITNVGLAFETARRTDINTIFDKSESDSSQGYEYVNGELVRPDSRYGLKIDGNVVIIEKDNSGQVWKDGINWYQFPVTIASLSAGIHEIELYNLGGYRAEMYNFQLTGLPHVENTHTHTLGDWQSDDNNHWKVCSGEGCPAAGAHLEEAAHTWVAGAVAVDGTKGTQTLTCSVCGKTSSISGGVYASFKWADALQAGSATLDGAKFKASSTYSLTVLNVPAAGTYTLALQMKGSAGNGGKILNGGSGNSDRGQGFTLSANGVNGSFYGAGKTYEEFFGVDQSAWVDIVFGEITLVEGTNTINIVTDSGGYRVSMNADVNLTLAAKA